MVRLLMFVAIVGLVAWCSTTVPIGDRPFTGHASNIWNSEETRELRRGIVGEAESETTQRLLQKISDVSAPLVERVARGVGAGVEAGVEAGTDSN